MMTHPTRFLLAGVALAALLVAGLLWLGSIQGPYTHFKPNVHEACGQPVALRAEGYNLLGGTRYGVDGGDPGDDVTLALVDLCDSIVQVLPNGEERLWVWLEIDSVGQTFPYYTWGIPEQDIKHPNANEWRDPVDPLWGYGAFEVTLVADSSGAYWPTTRGEVCPPIAGQVPGVTLFIDSGNSFTIPVGRTRAAWLCVRMGEGLPLPDELQITVRPGLARLTRWVDARITVISETPATTPAGQVIERAYALPFVHTNDEVCYHAQDTHPESIMPGGGCPHSG